MHTFAFFLTSFQREVTMCVSKGDMEVCKRTLQTGQVLMPANIPGLSECVGQTKEVDIPRKFRPHHVFYTMYSSPKSRPQHGRRSGSILQGKPPIHVCQLCLVATDHSSLLSSEHEASGPWQRPSKRKHPYHGAWSTPPQEGAPVPRARRVSEPAFSRDS